MLGSRLSGYLQLVGRQESAGQSPGFLVGGLEGGLVAPEKALRVGQAKVRMKCQCRMSLGFASVGLFEFLEFLPAPGSQARSSWPRLKSSMDHSKAVLQHPRTPPLCAQVGVW